MKKYSLLLMFACLSISYLQAQSIKYGVKAGLNTSNFAVSPDLDPPGPAARIGFHIGSFAQLSLVGNFSVQPELSFSTQRANDEDKDDWQRVKLSYINLAAPFKYTLDNKLHFSVGPQLGSLTEGEFEKEDKVDGDIKIQNAKHALAGTDLAVGFGLGYTLNLASTFSFATTMALQT